MTNKSDERVFSYNGDLSDLEYLNGFIKRKLGNLCYVSSCPRDKDDFVGIGLVREEMIKEDLDQSMKIILQDYADVFKAYFIDTESGLKLVAPSSKIVHEKMMDRLDRRTYSSEECIVESMGEKLLEIPAVRSQMNPLFEIVNYVSINGILDIEHLIQNHRIEKINKYSEFLNDIGVISLKDTILQPGKMMESKLSEWGPESAFDCISKNIGRKELNTLYSEFGFQNILPFLRMSNINCLSSFYIDKPLNWEPSMFGKNMCYRYHERNPDLIKILSQAYILQGVGIFKSDKKNEKLMFSCEPVYDDFRSEARKVLI